MAIIPRTKRTQERQTKTLHTEALEREKRSGIVSDPNRADDPEYITRLVGQVVKVSVETVRIVKGLPAEYVTS